MTITRRQFGQRIGTLALAGGIGEISMGLSCSSVFNDIATYVPVGLTAFEEVISLISPAEAALLTPIITSVKAAFADLAAAVTAYENAPAANKATLEGKISTAINAAISELQQFWSDAKLPDGTLASTISGVLQIILSTLAAFLPAVGGTLNVGFKQQAGSITAQKGLSITPVKRSQKQFKADVNAVFAKGGYPNKIY